MAVLDGGMVTTEEPPSPPEASCPRQGRQNTETVACRQVAEVAHVRLVIAIVNRRWLVIAVVDRRWLEIAGADRSWLEVTIVLA